MKIVLVAGARPNFMKVAPILAALRARRQTRPDLCVLLVHTGQHYDQAMSQDFFDDLRIPPPDINLCAGSGSHAEQTSKVMVAFEKVCDAEKPDWVIVVGDVNSTMACAITAKKMGIRVAHVEAGLRSRDMSMPEEINRLCTDCLSDLLFTTDTIACENLKREGVPEEKIHMVGNTMIDTVVRCLERARSLPLPSGLENGRFAVLTLHRPSNVDNHETFADILGAVSTISERIPIVFPAHPRTAATLAQNGFLTNFHGGHFQVTKPFSYLPFLGLVSHSRMVLTDSGGIQEETTYLGIPCLTLRSNTERPVTCQLGTNILVGTNPERIREVALSVLNGFRQRSSIPDKWDGHSAERIAETLVQ
jgi:UDP-N-acetylglucosamine 2-epimerase (non-hydrolysing)